MKINKKRPGLAHFKKTFYHRDEGVVEVKLVHQTSFGSLQCQPQCVVVVH